MADVVKQLEKLARYKEGFESETDEVMKAKYKGMIEKIEKEIAEAEKQVVKEEEKIEKKEEKVVDEVSEKIKKYTAIMDEADDPEVKSMYQKRIEKLKAQIGEVKEQIQEEKKELQEKKDELKEAVKEVKQAEKEVRTKAIKKAEKTQEDRKEIGKAKKERRRRLRGILTDLNKLVSESDTLRPKYQGEGVDLKRDAGRGSKPFGWRFKGKNNYRKPRPDQHGQPNVYYEGRPNRADVKPKGNVKLEDGGVIEDFMGAGFTLSNADKYALTSYQPNPDIFGYFDNMYTFEKWIKKNVNTDGVTFDSEYSMIYIEGTLESLEELVNNMIAAASLVKPGKTEEPDYSSLPKYNRPRRRRIDLGEMGGEFAEGGYMADGGKFGIVSELSPKEKAKIFAFLDSYNSKDEVYNWWEKFGYTKAESKEIENAWAESRGYKMAHGGKTQGYDDREDERLAMKDSKISKKDFVGIHKKKERSRRDDAGFEKRDEKGTWEWKPEAIEKKLIPKSAMKKKPSAYYRNKFPNLVMLVK